MTPTQEIWYVDIGGKTIHSSLEDIIQRIKKGSLLPKDKIKRGNLRWIEAQKVPLLLNHFNAVKTGFQQPSNQTTQTPGIPTTTQNSVIPTIQTPPVKVTEIPFIRPTQPPVAQTTHIPNIPVQVPNVPLPPVEVAPTPNNFVPPDLPQPLANTGVAENIAGNLLKEEIKPCAVHAEKESDYLCQTCLNYFCYDCPKTIGGIYNCCPLCGAVCKSFRELAEENAKSTEPEQSLEEGQEAENAEDTAASDPNQVKKTPIFPTTSAGLAAVAPRKPGIAGLIIGFIIALALSAGGAYLWAYQYSQPDEAAEKKLTQVVILDENFNLEKSGLILKYGAVDGKPRAESGTSQNLTLQQVLGQLQQKYDNERLEIIAKYRQNQAFETFYKYTILLFLIMSLVVIGFRKFSY